MTSQLQISKGSLSVLRIPTEAKESDGTLSWDATTMILVELEAAGQLGLGYTYAHASTKDLVKELLQKCVFGHHPFDIPKIWERMVGAERNFGRVGQGAMAVSAIDNALWDLKAKLLDLPLASLLGLARRHVPAYGSGGFTSYSLDELTGQLRGWADQGFKKVKMKIGLGEDEDLERVAHVVDSLGPDTALFVDANEAYDIPTALGLAERLAALGVEWFEQPIADEDYEGYRYLRRRFPRGLRLTTGEYFSDLADFRRALKLGIADVLQPDVTRCRGVTGFLRACAVCEAFHVPVSSHCAPALHLPLGCAVPNLLHLEYFHDHARLEQMLFAELPEPKNGTLEPDFSRPGFGLELKRSDAQRFVA